MTPAIPADIRTPAYVLDVSRLKKNLATARRVKAESGCRILLATKAFAMPSAFPLMREVLDGTTASGEYEARMGREEFGKEVHVYAPAYIRRRGAQPRPHRRPRLLQLAGADRALPADRAGGEKREGWRAHQSRLFQRHARRPPLRSGRAILALRHDARRDRPDPLGRHRHLSRAHAVRVPARRIGGPHRACGPRVRSLHPARESGELRRRAFHEQAGL